MEKNVGGMDRTLRIILGLVMVVAMMMVIGFGTALETAVQGTVASILLVLAFILLGTAGSQRCYVNRVLGRNTYVKASQQPLE